MSTNAITITAAEARALLYGEPKHEFSSALSRIAAWLADIDEPDCPACGGSGRMGPFFPGGLSTVCGNCTPITAKGVSE